MQAPASRPASFAARCGKMRGPPLHGATMNAPFAAPLFGAVDMAPRDPILGVTEAFAADANPNKVNLGVGVYCDDAGKVPLLACVRRAEQALTAKGAPHNYLPIDGIQAYDKAVRALLLGADSPVIKREPRRHRAGDRRHRRTQGRRGFPQEVRAGRGGMDQRSELGEPPRAVRRRRFHGRNVPVLRLSARAASTSKA